MCAQTRPRFILSSERVLGGMEFESMLTPREKSLLPENVPRGGSNPRRCGRRAQTLPTSYSGPEIGLWRQLPQSLDTSSGSVDWKSKETSGKSIYGDSYHDLLMCLLTQIGKIRRPVGNRSMLAVTMIFLMWARLRKDHKAGNLQGLREVGANVYMIAVKPIHQ